MRKRERERERERDVKMIGLDFTLPLSLLEGTICKSQPHFVSAAAAILKEVSLGTNLI